MKTTKAVIFTRISSTNERQNDERQIKDLSNYALLNELEVVEIFSEKISGATKIKDRKILGDCISFCLENNIKIILISELSRIGRNAFEVLEIVKKLIDLKINLYVQKENFSLFDTKGEIAIFAPVLIAVLSTCAQLERENIQFRLNSGRTNYKNMGGKLGRKKGSKKSKETKEIQYKNVLRRLRNKEKIRDIAKLENVGISTVQRLKKEFGL